MALPIAQRGYPIDQAGYRPSGHRAHRPAPHKGGGRSRYVFEGLKEALTAGERIELRGFGVFSVRARKTGIGRNPRTGTEVSITPGKAVRFKPGKELHTIGPGTEAAS